MTANTAPITEAEFLACEMAVLRALEVAAGRGRAGQSRPTRNANPGPKHQLYLQLRPQTDPAVQNRLLAGAWDTLAVVLPSRPDLYAACDRYVRTLLARLQPHKRDNLLTALVSDRG
jgi:hypothetical protein